MPYTIISGVLLGVFSLVFVLGAIIPFIFIGPVTLAVGAVAFRGGRRVSSGRQQMKG
jgi:hypothetical protein